MSRIAIKRVAVTAETRDQRPETRENAYCSAGAALQLVVL